MDEREAFLAEIDSFLAESGMAATALGRAAVNDGHFVRRLREHRGVTLTTVGRVRAYMAKQRAETAAKPLSPASASARQVLDPPTAGKASNSAKPPGVPA